MASFAPRTASVKLSVRLPAELYETANSHAKRAGVPFTEYFRAGHDVMHKLFQTEVGPDTVIEIAGQHRPIPQLFGYPQAGQVESTIRGRHAISIEQDVVAG